MTRIKNFFLLLPVCFACNDAMADVRLANIFGDNMVLQRDKPINIWGWCTAGEKVVVQFNKQSREIKGSKEGKWLIKLDAEAAGGPYQLVVKGKSAIIMKNILVGEVWLCSGQSNMEMTVTNSMNAIQEIQHSDFPEIRQIKVPVIISGNPAEDIASGEWKVAGPGTAGDFTAAGFFFARKLYEKLKVPIGLINASRGGTIIETWISREALEKSDDFKNIFREVSFSDVEAQNEKNYQSARQNIESGHGAVVSPASPATYASAALNDNDWKKMMVPANFNANGLDKFDGSIWFRKTIELGREAASQSATLNLSTIDDMDETYINGKLVGSSKVYNIVRKYAVPTGVLQEGKNVISIRVTDNSGNGGFFGKPEDINLACNNQMVSLAGQWSYKIEAVQRNPVNPNDYPALLFNGMINPLIPFTIKGVLWYQGESNALRAYQYRKAFPLLINDWRDRFRQGVLPFYYVQLASYNPGNKNSEGSEWAELREAQAKALSLPNTGMAVTLDIGETTDIHPKNKQEVGYRLANIALTNLYNQNQEYSGPVYKSVRIEGSKAIVSFFHADSGFLVKDPYRYIKGFVIAGADKKFHLAQAYIENGNIVVHSESVALPVAVRYGWQDDVPEANLYNKQGLPAAPFRTDEWKGLTDDVLYNVTRP